MAEIELIETNKPEDKLYCLKCKTKKDYKFADDEIKINKINRKYRSALCVDCNCKLIKFIKSDPVKPKQNNKVKKIKEVKNQ